MIRSSSGCYFVQVGTCISRPMKLVLVFTLKDPSLPTGIQTLFFHKNCKNTP